MFVVSEHTPSGWMPTRTNDIKDVYDIVLGITGRESEAVRAEEFASDMGFGGQYIATWWKLECVKEA